MKLLRFVPLVLVAAILGALVWRLANPPDTIVESRMVGQPVPAFSAPAAVPARDGVSSAGFADGKPRIVNFFASWCVPCISEAPVLMELKRSGAIIEGIAVRDRPEDIARFLQRNGDPFAAVGLDPQSKVQLAFGSAGVPESFIVDGRGTIRRQHVGPIEPADVPAILAELEKAR